MQRRTFITGVAATGMSLAAPKPIAGQSAESATPEGNTMTEVAPQTGYAPVNGLQMYYELHGAGDPLVLLHGAYATIDLWGPILSTLAENRQVIAVELQGHGHTADIDRPFSYEQMADDVAALMEHLQIPQADVVGYSMGGNTGLQLAIRHPELVRKLVAISANYRSDGYYPEVLAMIQTITPEMFAETPLAEAYRRNAPNPEDFPTLVEKHKAFDAAGFAWPEEDVAAITAPTLLIYGDLDIIRPEHMVELFRLLGGGVPGGLSADPPPSSQLAILPGITHVTIAFERTDVLLSMIEAFLDAPGPDSA